MARLTLSKKIAFATMVTAGVWLATEAAVTQLYRAELRAWASPPPPARDGDSVLHGNPYLIYEYAPGDIVEGGVPVHINSLGLRGPELTTPKPSGVLRFLTTGDSSVFGFGVKDDQVFSTVAAAQLGDEVEAVCGAIPGYSTYQTLNLLHLRALATEPDLIVVGNIWSDNNFDAFIDKDVLATYSGYEHSVWGRTYRLLSHSAIFRVADWKLRVRERAQSIRKVGWMMDSGPHIGLRRVSINDYARNLQSIVDAGREVGADALFLILPNNEDVREAHTTPKRDKAWDPYRQVIRDTAARNGAPVIDLPAIFIDSGHSADDLFIDEMHPTPQGHQLMADALVQVLRAADWPDTGKLDQAAPGGPPPHYTDPYIKGEESSEGQASPEAPESATRLQGEVICDSWERGVIQLDVIEPGEDAPTVINSIRLQGPGPFQVSTGAAHSVILRAYLDADEDGPDGDDRLIDLSGTVLDVSGGTLSRVLVDLDASRVEVGAASAPPPP